MQCNVFIQGLSTIVGAVLTVILPGKKTLHVYLLLGLRGPQNPTCVCKIAGTKKYHTSTISIFTLLALIKKLWGPCVPRMVV